MLDDLAPKANLFVFFKDASAHLFAVLGWPGSLLRFIIARMASASWGRGFFLMMLHIVETTFVMIQDTVASVALGAFLRFL